MEHYREAGKPLGDRLKDVEAQLRLLTGLELVSALRDAYGYREGIDACTLDEVPNLLGMRVESVLSTA